MSPLPLTVGLALAASASTGAEATTQEFAKEVERVLPVEKSYDYHRHLETAPVHVARRNPDAKPTADETALPERGWKLVWSPDGGEILRNAVLDFQDYLKTSMGISADVEARDSLDGWRDLSRAIVVGTREQLSGCGEKLKGPKDYRLYVTPERVTVCGFDARGAMFGLYNLEARMNLREEIDRTGLSLLAATRDSRLGFQQETDYVYTPYSLQEKLDSMRETLEKQLPEAQKNIFNER